MTKEISRSSRGPHWKTPLCPPWICEQEKAHQELIREFGKCPQCWRGYSEEEIDDAYRAQGINPKNGRKFPTRQDMRVEIAALQERIRHLESVNALPCGPDQVAALTASLAELRNKTGGK